MRKQKFYLGKRRLKHNEGKHNGKFVVPSLLRRWLMLRYKLSRWNMILKFACNSSVGSGAVGSNMSVSTNHYVQMVTYRRRIVKALSLKLSVQRLQGLLNEIEKYRDEQAQSVEDRKMVREAATKGYYDGVKRLNHDDVELTISHKRPGHCELYPGNLTMCLTDQCRVHPKAE